MCTVLLPPGDNPIAVNKYIISKGGGGGEIVHLSLRNFSLFMHFHISIICTLIFGMEALSSLVG